MKEIIKENATIKRYFTQVTVWVISFQKRISLKTSFLLFLSREIGFKTRRIYVTKTKW